MLMQVVALGTILLLLARAVGCAASNIALPGCNDTCGNISVPYPFGMGVSSLTGNNCFMDTPFQLFCGCFDKPAFLCLNSHTSILSISLEDGQFETQSIYSRLCYNDPPNKGGHLESLLYTGPFPISSKDNKLVTVGCDSYGYVYSSHDGSLYSTGCLSRCDGGFAAADKQALMNNNGTSLVSCMGVGCCQVDIPTAAIMRHYVGVNASTFDNFTKTAPFNNCTYAFIAKKGSYHNFSMSQLWLGQDVIFNNNNHTISTTTLPLVVDWSVGNSTCIEASRNRTQYACMNNSFCDDKDTVNGYRCRCKPGYDGNPYHPTGCIDIDECKTSQHNCISEDNCVNTDGSYKCFCPKGQSGTGTKEEGCHQQNILSKAFFGMSSSGGSIILVLALWGLHKIVRKRIARRRKEKFYKRNGGLLLDQKLSYGEVNVDRAKHFTLKNLEKATDNFNVNRVLGKGGQGTVYKGMLSDGKIVAVKRFKVEGSIDEFINEFLILSQINHRNVVNLLGCCLEAEIPLLVYEFIANGTLSEYLHEQNEELEMTWEVRLRIACEVAGALFYLHSAASRPIYHRDIKSSNILLDDKYRAKVADFGTSRMVAAEDDTHLTTVVQGTFGYLDPEYFRTSQFTEKSDVYSFGVVLVELVTGQRVLCSSRPQEAKSLASYFLCSMEENRLLDIVDERFKRVEVGRKKNDMFLVANLAARCLDLSGKKRPSMRDVAMELERIRKLGSNSTSDEICGIEEQEQPCWDAFCSSMTCTGSTQKNTTASSIEVMPIILNAPGYVSP